MKPKTILFIGILLLNFFILPVGASVAKCNIDIQDVKVHNADGKVPYNVGLISTISGDVQKVEYEIIDPATSETKYTVTVDCSKCVTTGICTRSCEITAPGTYDLRVIAYDSADCSVSTYLKSAIVANGGKAQIEAPKAQAEVKAPVNLPVKLPVTQPAPKVDAKDKCIENNKTVIEDNITETRPLIGNESTGAYYIVVDNCKYVCQCTCIIKK